MALNELDYGGTTLIVKDVKTGYSGPGRTGKQSVAAGSTLTLNANSHSGKTIFLDTLTGSVVTLPAATGTGNTYCFWVSVAPTSNNHIVKVANATDVITGNVLLTIVTGATSAGFTEATAATEDTITMNGTTTGGIKGSYFELTDVAAGFWLLSKANLIGSGSLATPFSATV